MALSKISSESGLTVNRELDYFKTPATETTELGTKIVPVTPASISQTLIKLTADKDDSAATDLSKSNILVKGRFLTKDGEALAVHDDAEMKYVAETNLAHSLWDKIELTINKKTVYVAEHYGQLAHFYTSLFSSAETKDSRLETEGWLGDKMKPLVPYADMGGPATTASKRLIADGKTVSLSFIPFTPFSNAPRFLPPNTNLELLLKKASTVMFTLSNAAAPDVKFHIDEITWNVHRIDLNPGLVQALYSRMDDGARIKMPVLKPRLQGFSIGADLQRKRIKLENQATLPLMIAVGLANHDHFVGSFGHSALAMTPCAVKSIELQLNGLTRGVKLETDYENGDATLAYQHTLDALGYGKGDVSNGLTYEKFKSVNTVYAWNLSSSAPSEWLEVFHLKKQCSMELVINFTANTPNALTLAVLDIREDLVQMDIGGNIECFESAE